MKKYLVFIGMLIVQNNVALVDITLKYVNDSFATRSVNAVILTHLGAGFFAEFGKVISSLIHYELDGIRSMYVDWTDQFFPFKDKPYENGWDLYFEPVIIEESIDPSEPVYEVGNCSVHELHDQLCVAQWIRYDDYLPYRLFVHEKINQHIHIKKHISDEVDSFYKKYMQDNVCIGVHVRYAKAHVNETPNGHPSLDTYCKEVNDLLKRHSADKVKIFLASDSHVVINHFKRLYKEKLIYIDTYRATAKEDPGLIYENSNYWITHPDHWHKAKPGYQGGLGALMDCLLLAKCDYLIHITSNVSTYVCFFNPYIKSIYLPRKVPFKHCRYRGDKSIRNKFLNPI
ncbi:MAG TPA: nodulation protein NodZ [Candidatus Dependentiae bacterium]|nr:nodulation protein NodZ [Candidatus Dependentiae bacterium]HRQ63114.1 nodulation protein NodZ [Candidatus Dependentiae bacterium]